MQPNSSLSLRFPLFVSMTLLAAGALVLGACDKDPSGPSLADYRRCAHIDREVELGEFLYSTCLNNPWPTELPPATQEGRSTFGAWINDTLAFVNGDPREFDSKTAYAGTINNRDHRSIIAKTRTYAEVDPRSIRLSIAIMDSGAFAPAFQTRSLWISGFSTLRNGFYDLDVEASSVRIVRWDNEVVSGSCDLWFYLPDNPSTRIHLVNGRFDLGVRPQ